MVNANVHKRANFATRNMLVAFNGHGFQYLKASQAVTSFQANQIRCLEKLQVQKSRCFGTLPALANGRRANMFSSGIALLCWGICF